MGSRTSRGDDRRMTSGSVSGGLGGSRISLLVTSISGRFASSSSSSNMLPAAGPLGARPRGKCARAATALLLAAVDKAWGARREPRGLNMVRVRGADWYGHLHLLRCCGRAGSGGILEATRYQVCNQGMRLIDLR